MALSITHTLVSAVVDDGVAGEVGPNEWNDDHQVAGTVDAAQFPALTGDVTTAGGALVTTLATVNGNVGTFGSATAASQVTVNAKGLVTAATNVTVTPAVGSITGLGADVAAFLATPSSANLATAVTGETGSGALVFGTSPTFTTGITTPIIALTGGQIAFPATQAASTDANTLDDYEEGSWTPVLTFATPGDLSVAYSTQVGRYVKVGKIVLAEVAITTTTFTHTTASGGVNITGIPFTSLNITGARSRVGCLWQGVTKANFTDMAMTLAENSTTISIAASGSAQNAVALAVADLPSGGNVRFDAALGYIADV